MFATAYPDPIQQSSFYADVPLKRAVAWVFDTVVIGLLALGGAAATPGTLVNELAGFPGGAQVTAFTPVGERSIGVEVAPGGAYLTVDSTVTLTTSIEVGVRREVAL